MIEIFAFNHNSAQQVEGDILPSKGTVWIRCLKPDDHDLARLADLTGIPKEEYQDVLGDEDERPRVESNRQFTMIVFKAPLTEGEEVTTTPLYFYIKGNLFITIADDPIKTLVDIRGKIRNKKAKMLFNKSPGYLLIHVLDKINDEFFSVIERISDTSEFLKKKVGEFSKKNIERIYSINTTLSYFNRALLANVEVLKNLKNNAYQCISPKYKPKTEDLYYDALTLLDTESVQRGIITGLFNIESVMNDYNLNESMKRLTSIMMILMIPTVITGVYGMNLSHMPFADHPQGFYIISGGIIFIIISTLLILRKNEWI